MFILSNNIVCRYNINNQNKAITSSKQQRKKGIHNTRIGTGPGLKRLMNQRNWKDVFKELLKQVEDCIGDYWCMGEKQKSPTVDKILLWRVVTTSNKHFIQHIWLVVGSSISVLGPN